MPTCGLVDSITSHMRALTGMVTRVRVADYPRGMLRSSILLSFAAATLCACEASPPDREIAVGRQGRRYVDGARQHFSEDGPRPLLTTVWHPAPDGSPERPWNIGVFRAGFTAVGAPLPVPPKPRPLVVMSHGTGGAAAQLSWAAEALVSRGFIVAAVNHHGNTAAEPTVHPQGFALWWERAVDLKVLIDRLIDDPVLGPHIDPSRIGALGFSLGGYTVLSVAGARLDLKQWQALCQTDPTHPSCVLPPEAGFDRATLKALAETDSAYKASLARAGNDFADPRIRAVFAIAPVHGPALTEASLASIHVPVAIVVGERDTQARPSDVSAVHKAIAASSFEKLAGVGHYTFLAPCTRFGRWFAGPLCEDPSGTDRARVHQRVGNRAVEFFKRTLSSSKIDP